LAGFFSAVVVAAVRGDEAVVPARDDARWQHRQVSGDARDWWAFQPLGHFSPPSVDHGAWVRTPIDRFVLARLENAGLDANPSADRRTLVRRAYLDLTGLPPTPEEVDAFLEDQHEDAFERLIDRLLASPHYGERWARYWLDVARFAESHGFEQDYDRPNAYHYRDFVIKAFNGDMPYDQFVRWQIAGDELAPSAEDEPLAWMATGILGAGAFPTQLTEAEFEPARYDELDDMAATTGAAFLGVSIGCARCHDHKFDPLPQGDYYRFVATFTTAIRSEVELDLRTDEEKRQHAAWEAAHRELAAELVLQLKTAKGTDREKALQEIVEKHKSLEPPGLTKVQVVREGIKPAKHHADERGFPHFYPETHYLARGDVSKKEGIATQGFPQVLTSVHADAARWQHSPPEGATTPHRRAALARWITDTEYGPGHLLARVIVNRLWQHHFGRGIVATPNDFGVQGAPPTHPELLDWLAAELIRGGWRLKPMHKLMMTSSVYMQSSDHRDNAAAVDPENDLLWRWRMQRLEAEAIRDSMLAVGGLLDRTMYGPGTLDESMTRRSIYFFTKRSQLIPSMQLFDAPECLVSQGARPTTTTAPAALYFMNDDLVRRCAEVLAERMMGAETNAVERGYRIVVGRPPTEVELRDAEAFLRQQQESYAVQESNGEPERASAKRAMVDFAQALLSLNEFIYVP
jgi:hypothetical protein